MVDMRLRLCHASLYITTVTNCGISSSASLLRRISLGQTALEIDVMRLNSVANLHQTCSRPRILKCLRDHDTNRLIRVAHKIVLQDLHNSGWRPARFRTFVLIR